MFSKNHVFYRCGGELRAYTRDGGMKVWGVREATGFIAERGNRMLLSGPGDMVLSVDKNTGQILGRTHAGGWIFPPRSSPDTTIYAISRSGVVLSVEVGF